MKANYFFGFLIFGCLFGGQSFSQQNQPAYQLPANFNFDFEVVQTVVRNRPNPDTAEVHYFFTRSGDYAGGRYAGKMAKLQNDFVILTKDGTAIIFNDAKKTILLFRPRNIIPDLVNLAKDFMSVNFSDSLKHRMGDKKIQAEKTGKTKLISGYTAEEYRVSDNENRTGYAWIAKVDFNTQLYYILALAGSGPIQVAISKMASANPLFQTLSDPMSLLIETNGQASPDGKGMDIRTLSINKTALSVPTSGYTVKNYSNMSLREILEAENQKKNN